MHPQRLMVVEDVYVLRGRAVLFPGVDDDRCTLLVGARWRPAVTSQRRTSRT